METEASSALLAGTSWPFQQRAQEEQGNPAIQGRNDQAASSFGPPSSMSQNTEPAPADTAPSSLKEPKPYGNITAKQAEWEKQLESADQKQAELFHFQWNLIKEQLSHLTREMQTLRQDNDALRAHETRWEVREADFARVVRETQADFEKEVQVRRKDSDEFANALSQVRQVMENERADRTQALQALEQDVAEQLLSIKGQQRQQLEADKDLSSRFEHWCVELRATLDKESSVRGQKLDELVQKLEQETKDVRALEEQVSSLPPSVDLLQNKFDALKKQFEQALVVIDSKHADVLKLVDLCAKEEDFQEQKNRIDDIMAHYKNLGERLTDLADEVTGGSKLNAKVEELTAADAENAKNLEIFVQRVTAELEQERKENAQQHQSHLDRHMQSADRLTEEMDLRLKVIEETQENHAKRIEEVYGLINETLSKVGNETELLATKAAGKCIEDLATVPRAEFEQVLQRLWEALDSHTHDVDVNALKTAQDAAQQQEISETFVSPYTTASPTMLIPQPSLGRGPNRTPVRNVGTAPLQPALSVTQPGLVFPNSASVSLPTPLGSGSMTLPVAVTTSNVPQNLGITQTLSQVRTPTSAFRAVVEAVNREQTSSITWEEAAPPALVPVPCAGQGTSFNARRISPVRQR